MSDNQVTASTSEKLSPWWRNAVILIMVFGFSILLWLAARTYVDAPPIPEQVVSASSEMIFTGADILAGQEVFLKYGLMENGSIWGHGAYLGPDFSAEYLHTLSVDASETIAQQRFNRGLKDLTAAERSAVNAEVEATLKQNRYDAKTKLLTLTPVEIASYRNQIVKWTTYFAQPTNDVGLPASYIKDAQELKQLTAFFAWAAWASVTNRPGATSSYTNNFPFDPTVGNTPTSDAILWSALSLIGLLGGTALALLAWWVWLR